LIARKNNPHPRVNFNPKAMAVYGGTYSLVALLGTQLMQEAWQDLTTRQR